jgi:glycosyltransferase involved in cell wall biosynthesis
MRIAIVHDYLCGLGGSERVFKYICEAFPEADVYTLAYSPSKTLSYFKHRNIKTTWLGFFVRSMNSFRWSYPLATYVMQNLDLSEYNLVLSSSASVAKYIKVKNGEHICYCYIPTRALWQENVYFGKSWKYYLIRPFISFLRKRDLIAAQNVNKFIAISEFTKNQIKLIYNRESEIIFSPIDIDSFYSSVTKSDYYLIVSRLEPWKKIDYAIEAFNKLNLPLRIVGTGIDEKKLKALANDNIIFLGSLNDSELAEQYSKAKAVIFTPFLEYGLIPLEANASGTPVICYGKGGVNETMIPFSKANPSISSTAVFFYEQSANALIDAVHEFSELSFDANFLIQHASKWSVAEFKKQIKKVIYKD